MTYEPPAGGVNAGASQAETSPCSPSGGQGGLFRSCASCGYVFRKPHEISWDKWRVTQCCSRSCAAKLRHRDGSLRRALADWRFIPKKCARCGTEFLPAEGLSKYAWDKRRFCSHGCHYETERGVKRGKRAAVVRITRKEWPAEARFDAPGMCVPDGPGHFVKVTTPLGRWL